MPTDRESELFKEAYRTFKICNACRYCEGFCDVFPSMQKLLEFDPSKMKQLASVCHDCRECYYACQYIPPHEYAINVPKVMGQIRNITYKPNTSSFIQKFFTFFSLKLVTIIIIPVLFVTIGWLTHSSDFFLSISLDQGSFYYFMDHRTMLTLFIPITLLVILMIIYRINVFSKIGHSALSGENKQSSMNALWDGIVLKNLRGNGSGCKFPGEKNSKIRHYSHHLLAGGFILCFISTSIGTIYHYAFNWFAPYSILSLPVIFGFLGGLGIVMGSLSLLWQKQQQDMLPVDASHDRSSSHFTLLLLLVALSGLMLLLLRDTYLLATLLYWHLGLVASFFLAIPYEKMMHVFFRVQSLKGR